MPVVPVPVVPVPVVPVPVVPVPVVPALVLLTALVLAPLSALLAPAARAAPAWAWPLPGSPSVQRPFAPGPTPYSGGHYGVDLVAPPGAPVLAAGAGTVSFAGTVAGRGTVVVDHGGLRTSYEPVEAAVAVGDAVALGDLLGAVAPLGHACLGGGGSCLHWGLRDGERYLDPLRLVRRPVRLLATGGQALAVPPVGAHGREAERGSAPRPLGSAGAAGTRSQGAGDRGAPAPGRPGAAAAAGLAVSAAAVVGGAAWHARRGGGP